MAINAKIIENANKVTYLATQYPDKSLVEILKMFQLPAIDTNTAIWAAVGFGWIAEIEKETDVIKTLDLPEEWHFGKTVDDLEDEIVYAFEQTSAKEADVLEYYYSQWTAGYATHDVIVATKHLLEEERLAEYVVVDVDETGTENKYTFYTLFENRDKEWGYKQFKEDPRTKTKPAPKKTKKGKK